MSNSDTDTGSLEIVLVHGAMHGAWCWERLIPLLEADPRVRTVVAVDLPGHGDNQDGSDPAAVTLDDYVDCVVDTIESRNLTDVVLVGHSLGGLTITPAAHRVADRLHRLVYLATICPPIGATVLDLMVNDPRPEMKGGQIPDMFCTDFDDDTRTWLLDRLGDQPPKPLTTPVDFASPPAHIDRTYILCERDEATTPAFQAEQAATIDARIVRLDAGHSPFATHVDELAAILLEN